jgi:hypothetical protein
MEKKVYKIDHSTNNFKVYAAENILKYSASWFLEFGKTTSEIYSLKNEILYNIAKKFKFWKWRISYTILNKNKENLVLNSKNKENSVFQLQLANDSYEVQIHYFEKKSIYKNGFKIAEIADGFSTSKEESTSNLLLLNTEDLEIVFLLFTCLKTGEVHQKPIMKSQKEWIPIEDKWDSLYYF